MISVAYLFYSAKFPYWQARPPTMKNCAEPHLPSVFVLLALFGDVTPRTTIKLG